MIFISGTYGGDKRNKEIAEECARYLYRHFKRDIYVSGIFSFAREYEDIDLDECITLMSKCDKVIFLSNYKNSSGANTERDYAKFEDIESYYFDLDTRLIYNLDKNDNLDLIDL